jgi:hypothetical protein
MQDIIRWREDIRILFLSGKLHNILRTRATSEQNIVSWGENYIHIFESRCNVFYYMDRSCSFYYMYRISISRGLFIECKYSWLSIIVVNHRQKLLKKTQETAIVDKNKIKGGKTIAATLPRGNTRALMIVFHISPVKYGKYISVLV